MKVLTHLFQHKNKKINFNNKFFKVKNYNVEVFTGDVLRAGTDSNVFITLFGEFGDSGEKKLVKSETHMNKFERNQVF